jgi:hypothetical protein
MHILEIPNRHALHWAGNASTLYASNAPREGLVRSYESDVKQNMRHSNRTLMPVRRVDYIFDRNKINAINAIINALLALVRVAHAAISTMYAGES